MKRGFTLLEVMLALAIFALAATAVFRLRVTSWTAKEHKVP